MMLTVLFSLFALSQKPADPAAVSKLEDELNQRLLTEARFDQCAFAGGSIKFVRPCDDKLDKLAKVIADTRKKLAAAKVKTFKFEVSGHTDSTGDAAKNKDLTAKRAAVIVKELVKRGVPEGEIEAVGKGSESPLVTPDDSALKKAKNRRYELRVHL